MNPVDDGDLRLANAAFSTVVTSDVPIVSERAMYWPGDDTPFGEGHASSGLTDDRRSTGCSRKDASAGRPPTRPTSCSRIRQSPAADVTVTFLPETGAPIVKTFDGAAPRAASTSTWAAMVPELQNESFGARVEVTNDVPIAVERSMYWNVGRAGSGRAGSNALGADAH